MMARIGLIIVALGLCTAALPAPGTALEVYQWTDENGVIHFSQWAPAEDVENVETVTVGGGGEGDNGIGISEADDPEGYKAHREEMDALWAEIEARREAERRRQSSGPTSEIVYLPSEPGYGFPFFFPGHGLRPPFKPHRPRPPMEEEEPQMPPVKAVPYKRP